MAIWTGQWWDVDGKPFDPAASGPRACNPHAPTHVVRHGTHRSSGQDAMLLATSVLAAKRWPALSPAQKAMYSNPTGGFGPTNRGANELPFGGFAFFVNANIGTELFGDPYFNVSTNDKIVPIADMYLHNHAPEARSVDLHFQYYKGHPPYFTAWTDLHFAQVHPRHFQSCKTWYWTRTFHLIHFEDHEPETGWTDYDETLIYPWPVRPDNDLEVYCRIHGPDYLPSTATQLPIPLVPS
jgi:hypothetical protein